MPTAIRLATTADAEVISSLNADVQAIHWAALPSRFKPPGLETFPPTAAAALLAQSNNVVFISEVDSIPVGYAYAEVIHRPETSLHHAYDMVYLHHISVRPEHRKRGLGGALMDAVRSAASEKGISLVALDVWTFNEEARSFFRRHGFTSYNERLWNSQKHPIFPASNLFTRPGIRTQSTSRVNERLA
jgi:ribosomal protein S18 acetylase RimI-like enzyme